MSLPAWYRLLLLLLLFPGIMTAKLLGAFARCFEDEFSAVRAEACVAAGRLRIGDGRIVDRLRGVISDDPIHRVKALAIQGLTHLVNIGET